MTKWEPLVLVSIFILASLSGCLSDKTSPVDENQSNSEYRKLVTSEGEERKFIVTVPDSVNESTSVPVVIVLHGTRSTGIVFHDKPDL